MTDEPNTTTELHSLWQAQPSEDLPMSLERIHRRAHQLQSRIDRERLLVYAIVAIAVPLYSAAIILVPDRLATTGFLLTLLGIVFVLYVNHRHNRTDSKTAEAADCLNFHRRTLAQRRTLLRYLWAWALLPILPGAVLMFVYMHRLMASVSPHSHAAFGLEPATFTVVADTVGMLAVAIIVAKSQWNAHRLDKELKQLGG